MKKMEIKPGRSVSEIEIMMGIMGIVFVIFWIGMLLHFHVHGIMKLNQG